MLDIIVKTAKGGTFSNQSVDAAKTVVNTYGKLNQTESAKMTNRLIAIRMMAKDKNEERKLVEDMGIIATGKIKKLKN